MELLFFSKQILYSVKNIEKKFDKVFTPNAMFLHLVYLKSKFTVIQYFQIINYQKIMKKNLQMIN